MPPIGPGVIETVKNNERDYQQICLNVINNSSGHIMKYFITMDSSICDTGSKMGNKIDLKVTA